jgi:hypothetical protein
MEEAKQIMVDINERQKALYFIKENCPKKGYGYDDRDRYDTCTLKKKYVGDECKCEITCVNYIDKSKIDNDNFMKVYIRKLKIKELKK